MADPAPSALTTTTQTAEQVKTGAAIINTALPPPSPKICARPAWGKLPQFDRSAPIIMFGMSCLPGSETSTGCPPDKAAYVIAVPLTQLVVNGGTAAVPVKGPTIAGGEYRVWTAPGGNRYWATDIPDNVRDPKVRVLLRLMAAASRKKFIDTFGKGSNKNLTLAEILNKKEWAASYGIISVEQPPILTETAADFIRRGGYLLNLNDIIRGGKLDFYASQPWMRKAGISHVELWGNYLEVAANGPVIGYSIRLVYEGAWDTVRHAVIDFINDISSEFCDAVRSDEAMMVGAAAGMTPTPYTQAYAAVYGAALVVCDLPWTPPNCIPPAPLPGDAIPMTAFATSADPRLRNTNVKAAGAWAKHQAGMTSNLATLFRDSAPAPGQVATAPILYPEGTIAWFDLAAKGYRLAAPFPGDGTTHRELASVATSLPAEGIRLVDRRAWEKATWPWLRRGSTKLGLAIGGGVAALGLAVALLRSR